LPAKYAERPAPRVTGWDREPSTTDERNFTTHAALGWQAWNGMSPEQEFCEFAATMARVTGARIVIETGVGQGYTTRRLLDALRPHGGTLLAFESDAMWRGKVPLDLGDTPTGEQLAAADLTVLDSDVPVRLAEIARWRTHARAGALLLVHDCGNGHADDTPHAQIREHIESLGIAGRFLANPRGGFLGIQSAGLRQLPRSGFLPPAAGEVA